MEESTAAFFCLLEQRRSEKKFCDVILIAEKIEFPAHKFILSVASSYFYKIFQTKSDLSERIVDRIVLEEIKSDALCEIIRFTYERKININENNVQSLWAASQLLQYPTILKMCMPIIRKPINIKNCLQLLQIAKLNDEETIIDSVAAFLGNNFREIIKENAFINLNYDELIFILSRTEVIFENEVFVFEGIINWIKNQEVKRKKYLIDLMKYIKMHNLSTSYLARVVSLEPLIQNTEGSYRMIAEAYQYNEIFKYKLIGFDTRFMHIYNIIECKWDMVKELPKRQHVPSAYVKLDNILYIICMEPKQCNTLYAYDQTANSFKLMCSMLSQRSNFTSAILNGKIYVVGGSNENKLLKLAEVYDPKTNQWKSIPDMIFDNIDSVVIKNNFLYVTCKRRGKKLRMVQYYDAIKNEWDWYYYMKKTSIKNKSLHNWEPCLISYKPKLKHIFKDENQKHLMKLKMRT